jgi:uncharacterized protein (TIRG00374 family)
MQTSPLRPGRKRFWAAGLLGLALLAYTIHQADFDRLLTGFQDADRLWLVPVLICSVISYLCIAAVLHHLLKGIRQPLTFATTLRISMISCTLNYLMALAGLSGIAAKVYLLARERIPPRKTLSVSMVHGFLTNTVAIVLIYFGAFSLLSHRSLGKDQIGLAVLILLITLGLTWFTVRILVSASFRASCWGFGLRHATRLSHRINRSHWIDRSKTDAFFHHFDDSMKLLTGRNRLLCGAAGFALFDWLFMFLCLACSFQAARCPTDFTTLLAGFSVAIFTALFSITPVGIGLMEGSMVGSFYLLGLDYDKALVAVLIYRLAYYILPLAVSFPLFHNLLTPASEAEES